MSRLSAEPPVVLPDYDARLDLAAELQQLEQLVARRQRGTLLSGEWACARFAEKPGGEGKKRFMRDMLADVTAALERATGEPAFLTYGTLLGAVRSRDVMEWTGDLDLALSERTAASLGSPAMQRALLERGYAAFFAPRPHEHPGGIWRICATPTNTAAQALRPTGTWGEAAQPDAPTAPLSWEATWAEMDRVPYVDVYSFGRPDGERSSAKEPALDGGGGGEGRHAATAATTAGAAAASSPAGGGGALERERWLTEGREREREREPLGLEGWQDERSGADRWRQLVGSAPAPRPPAPARPIPPSLS